MIAERNTETLGIRIQRERKRKRMSQEAFAEQSGISTNTLSAIENDRREPRLTTVIHMAHILGVSIDFLVTGYQPDRFDLSPIHPLVGELSPLQAHNLENIVLCYCEACLGK